MDFSPPWIGIYISWTGMLVSLVMSIHAVRQAGSSRRHRIASESPFFNFARLLIGHPWDGKNPTGQFAIMSDPKAPDTKSVPREYPKNGPVMMCGHNQGAEARQVEIQSSPEFPTALSFINKAHAYCVPTKEELQILYGYDPARRGKREKVTVHFRTVGGDKVTHKFIFTHGSLEVERL